MTRTLERGTPMSSDSTGNESHTLNGWYELFSRGSRDWLRHSEKIREAVREHLPQIVVGLRHHQ